MKEKVIQKKKPAGLVLRVFFPIFRSEVGNAIAPARGTRGGLVDRVELVVNLSVPGLIYMS